MPRESNQSARPGVSIPADDLNRTLAVAQPDVEESLPHIGLVGDTYTILLTGKDTAERFCLIDMHIPPGGGPPPHRHDFEETFTLLEGETGVHLSRSQADCRIWCDYPHSRERSTSVSKRLS